MVLLTSYQTKMKISSTLEEILAKKSLSKITVSELMLKSQMSRQTFYRYFLDIDDVVFWLYNEHAKKPVQTFDDSHSFCEGICSMAVIIKEHAPLYINAVKKCGPISFETMFFNVMVSHTRAFFGESHINDNLNFVILQFWYGATYSLIEWVRGGMKRAPELLAEYMYSGMPEIMKKFYY